MKKLLKIRCECVICRESKLYFGTLKKSRRVATLPQEIYAESVNFNRLVIIGCSRNKSRKIKIKAQGKSFNWLKANNLN